jgi:hypothetical protein
MFSVGKKMNNSGKERSGRKGRDEGKDEKERKP